MRRFRVQPEGQDRRRVTINGAYLAMQVVVTDYVGPLYDAQGNEVAVVESCEIRDPAKPSPEQIRITTDRAAICKECPSLKKLRADRRAVDCRDCGCGYMSLINGRCPLGKW